MCGKKDLGYERTDENGDKRYDVFGKQKTAYDKMTIPWDVEDFIITHVYKNEIAFLCLKLEEHGSETKSELKFPYSLKTTQKAITISIFT